MSSLTSYVKDISQIRLFAALNDISKQRLHLLGNSADTTKVKMFMKKNIMYENNPKGLVKSHHFYEEPHIHCMVKFRNL
jgi:hypothetical protein